jgi:DNA-binding transcriptional LysR family regulator
MFLISVINNRDALTGAIPMAASLDLDQLRTFVAIAETGSFTRAGDLVYKTQSAVSMQMRRLEERIGKPIFARDGRASRLTEEGERLLGYARRMVRLADETVAAFDDTELSGSIRLGTPDDYADRFLPEILARFSRSNPRVEVSVTCEPSPELIRQAKAGEVDLAIVTNCGEGQVQVIRREPLLWVVGAQHGAADVDVLPLALSKPPCMWRAEAIAALTGAGRKYRVLYQSSNATAIAAAV